jgi:hypothetical protein
MSSEAPVSAGMLRDVEALRQADATFLQLHGDESRCRWREIADAIDAEAPSADESLTAFQRRLAAAAPPDARLWEAIAWEVSSRIGLFEEARAGLQARPAAGSGEAGDGEEE